MSSPGADKCLRAITDDGSFRVLAVSTSHTTAQIADFQGVSHKTAETLSDLVTATVLFRETMAPSLRVQGILKSSNGEGTVVADSAPEGRTRGLVQAKSAVPLLANEGALLQVMRSLRNGSINQGVVRVPSGGGITQAMMAYLQESELVVTMLSVAPLLGPQGTILAAGGSLVQLLPEIGKAPLAVMAERLEDFRTIHHLLRRGMSPEELLFEILHGMPYTPLEESPLSADCWCSEERLLGAIATLGQEEIRSMISDAAPLEINCDYCRKEYTIHPSKLAGLVGPN